jgi:hypothetical protein
MVGMVLPCFLRFRGHSMPGDRPAVSRCAPGVPTGCITLPIYVRWRRRTAAPLVATSPPGGDEAARRRCVTQCDERQHRGNVTQTQQERKAETRARLLGAAAALFAEQGVDAVSVDAVAEAAGRTSGAVYAHFGSKQGLLLALLDSWKDAVRTVLLAEVAVSESPQGSAGRRVGQRGRAIRRSLRPVDPARARALAARRPRRRGRRA